MKQLIYIFLLGIFIIQLSCKKENELNIQGETALELEVFNLINDYRDSIGLDVLDFNDTITEECRIHSYNMATGNVDFGHAGFDARAEKLRIELNAIGTAENVAAGYMTAEEVVDGWINSPGHKTNIEGNYNLTGVGIVNDSEGTPYFTQIFINKPDN